MEEPEPALMGCKAAAAYLGLSETVLQKAVVAGKLKGFRPSGPNGRIYFTKEHLDVWIHERPGPVHHIGAMLLDALHAAATHRCP